MKKKTFSNVHKLINALNGNKSRAHDFRPLRGFSRRLFKLCVCVCSNPLRPSTFFKFTSLLFVVIFLRAGLPSTLHLTMQSDHTAIAMKKLGHARRQSYGKLTPISALLSNFIAIQVAPTPNTPPTSPTSSRARSAYGSPQAVPVKVNERSDATPTIMATIDYLAAQAGASRPPSCVQFLKCVNYQRRESWPDDAEPIEITDATHDTEDDIDRLLSAASDAVPLEQHTGDTSSSDSTDASMAYDGMDRLQLPDGGLYNKHSNTSSMVVCISSDVDAEPSNRLSADFPSSSSCDSDEKAMSNQSTASPMSDREKFLTNMLEADQMEQSIEMGDAIDATDSIDAAGILPLTEQNLKQFEANHSHEKRSLDELLTKEPQMNSAAVRLRLAARKLEMDLLSAEAAGKSPDEYIPPRELVMHVVR